jgi:bacillithiol biosynthesis cysteine-adding enzyme BshC
MCASHPGWGAYLLRWDWEMDAACIRQTELPGTTALFADYLYAFDRVARFYAWDPHSTESFRRAAAAIDFQTQRRAALVEALREQNGPGELLDLLARPETVAVVTGQQVGLFSGPCYTVYKALTAVRLARQLSEAGLPAAPVFWLATEDHDFAEVDHCWVFNARQQTVRLQMPGESVGSQPVGRIQIAAAPVEGLREALTGLPFAAEVVAAVERAYAPGETLGSAFGRLLKDVLGPQAPLLFDPLHPAARRLAAPALGQAARLAHELSRRVLERGAALTAAGYHAQVLVEPHTSFLFLLEGGRRVPLRLDGDGFVGNGRRYTSDELVERAEDLSPNALLRPVIQDSMLPTVAYVGGPAEVAYLAQSGPLYDRLLGRMPVAVPRQSLTLLDARAAKLMARYHLTLDSLVRGGAGEGIAAQLVPPHIEAALRETSEKLWDLLESLGAELERFDPTLGEAFARSRRKIGYQMLKTDRKVAREALRRDDRAQAEAAYLHGLLYPEKRLQERLYSILPFLARHGGALIGRLAEEVRLDCPDHRVITL